MRFGLGLALGALRSAYERVWLLTFGTWSDLGVWDDNATWNDGE